MVSSVRMIEMNETKKIRVWSYWWGCQHCPIHRCYPNTEWRGEFCLQDFSPEPLPLSLSNLDISPSDNITMLTPSLRGHLINIEPMLTELLISNHPYTRPPSSWITGAHRHTRPLINDHFHIINYQRKNFDKYYDQLWQNFCQIFSKVVNNLRISIKKFLAKMLQLITYSITSWSNRLENFSHMGNISDTFWQFCHPKQGNNLEFWAKTRALSL